MENRFFRWGALLIVAAMVVIVLVEQAKPEEEQNGLTVMLAFIVAGVLGAILFVTWVLPTIGDKMTEALVSSGERVRDTPGAIVARHIAGGDYEAAIDELQKQSLAEPQNPRPVLEIARLHLEKLDDPQGALQSLHTALISREWPPVHEATLRLRLADLLLSIPPPNFEAAKAEVQGVVDRFPGTPQAVDAATKLREIQEKQFLASRQG
ncbi:MAG: hypothetical protein ACKV19_17480 [Verrucomicrobiales bacterium]